MRKDTEAGIRLHEAFLESHPDNPLARYHLGYAYGLTGDHRREIACYEKALDLGYAEGALLFNLGMAYGETGQYGKAVEVLERAVDSDPDNPDYRVGLGLALERTGNTGAAIEALREAIRIDPNAPWARDLLRRLETGG
jgi:tetratricopeptide (TPR) repeat protein